MKKFKKLIALACVATMLIPSVAFAAEQTSPSPVESGGDSVVENDNSQPVEYTTVVVPTIPEKTYDFKIDPYGLLPKYDTQNTYDTGDNVFFTSVDDAAKVELVSGAHLAVQTYTPEDFEAGNALYDKLAALTIAVTDDDLKDYYVWIPTYDEDDGTTATGYGKFEPLKAANVDYYITLTPDASGGSTYYSSVALAPDSLSGEHIWDGKIYNLTYTDYNLATTNVPEQIVETHNITVNADGNVISVNNLYGSTDGTDYELITPDVISESGTTTGNHATYFTYKAATTKFSGTSNVAKVTNKSTNPIAVSVTVNLTAEGLTFDDDGTFTTDAVADTTASIYAAITDTTTNKIEIEGTDGNGTATAYYVIGGANRGDLITFQGELVGDSATGSHNYYNYEAPGTTFNSQSFNIEISANPSTNAEEAWDAYVEALNSTEDDAITKPEIEVIYNWVSLTSQEDVTGTIQGDDPSTPGETETEYTGKVGTKYFDDAKNEYAVGTTDGWAAFTTGHTHTYDDYRDLDCNGEDCDYERTSQIVKALTFSMTSDKTKSFISIGANATISSVKVFDANAYASDGNTASLVGTIEASKFTVSSSGNALIANTDITSVITSAGTYVIEITASNGVYTVIYTK